MIVKKKEKNILKKLKNQSVIKKRWWIYQSNKTWLTFVK